MSSLAVRIVTNVSRSTQIGGKWLWFDFFFLFFLQGDLYQDVSVCPAWDFCMLLIPSLVLHRPITLQNCSPLWHVLNHNLLHLFFPVKEFIFSFHFSVSREFAAVVFFFSRQIWFRVRLETGKRVDSNAFSCGWLLIGDALCTFWDSHLQVLPQRWCFVIGLCHSLREAKHLISISVGWWHQTDKSWSILISNINKTKILPSKHVVHKPFLDTGVL